MFYFTCDRSLAAVRPLASRALIHLLLKQLVLTDTGQSRTEEVGELHFPFPSRPLPLDVSP